MKEIYSDPEILYHAISDGINRFVRDVLLPNGLIDEASYYADQTIDTQREIIVSETVKNWKRCEKADDDE